MQRFLQNWARKKLQSRRALSGNYPPCNFQKIYIFETQSTWQILTTRHNTVFACWLVLLLGVSHSFGSQENPATEMSTISVLISWLHCKTGWNLCLFFLNLFQCEIKPRRDLDGNVKCAARGKSQIRSFERYWLTSVISGVYLEVIAFKTKNIFWTRYLFMLYSGF